MKNKERSADILMGLGASFVLMTLALALLFMAFPLPEVNTYSGGLTGVLLSLFFVAGVVLFTTGILLDRGLKFRRSRVQLPMAVAGGAPEKDERQKEDIKR